MKNREQIKKKYKELQESKRKIVEDFEKFKNSRNDTMAITRIFESDIRNIDSKLVILDWVLENRITGIGSIE